MSWLGYLSSNDSSRIPKPRRSTSTERRCLPKPPQSPSSTNLTLTSSRQRASKATETNHLLAKDNFAEDNSNDCRQNMNNEQGPQDQDDATCSPQISLDNISLENSVSEDEEFATLDFDVEIANRKESKTANIGRIFRNIDLETTAPLYRSKKLTATNMVKYQSNGFASNYQTQPEIGNVLNSNPTTVQFFCNVVQHHKLEDENLALQRKLYDFECSEVRLKIDKNIAKNELYEYCYFRARWK